MEIDIAEMGAADDRCFEAMADESRRRVLTALCEAGASLSLTELAVELVEAETDVELGVGNASVERRKIELYHRHVPKLADAGLVEFDVDSGTVALTAEFDGADDTSELLAA